MLRRNWDRLVAHYGPAIGENQNKEQSPRLECASKKSDIPRVELRGIEGGWNNDRTEA